MITTANYIVKVVAEGETYVFEYETGDVWTALEEFWHEDWECKFASLERQCFAVDVFAMENGKPIRAYAVAFEMSCYHGFFDHGKCTLDEFAKYLTEIRKELDAKKSSKNDVTSFMFYMWNAWCEEECKLVFGKDDFWPHFWNKWCHFCDKYSRFGATEEFYAELSDHNRDKLVKRALEVYEGNHDKRY